MRLFAATALVFQTLAPLAHGQMEDNIRTVQNLRRMTPEEMADVRKKAIAGAGVYTGSTLEYWKKKV